MVEFPFLKRKARKQGFERVGEIVMSYFVLLFISSCFNLIKRGLSSETKQVKGSLKPCFSLIEMIEN